MWQFVAISRRQSVKQSLDLQVVQAWQNKKEKKKNYIYAMYGDG